jgi:predicted dehydrogenase
LRVGLVGCGRWGRLILRDLLSCGAEVHVVEQASERAPALDAHAVSHELSSVFGLDGVIVATPASTHAGIAQKLLAADCPIFVEKPMTTDVASARRLAEAAPDRLFVMDKWRYHPGVQAMRAEFASGRAGDILAIRTSRWQWGHAHADVSPLWTLAPHDLSIIRHLLGDLPPLVHASAFRVGGALVAFTAELRYASGPTAILDVGVASPENGRRCLVVGSRATIELRGGIDENVFVRDGGPGDPSAQERTIPVGKDMPLLAEIRAFLGYLRGGPPPLSNAREGLASVERLAEIATALDAQRTLA